MKVWDGSTRLFHWSLFILFCMAAYSGFQDKFGSYADMHLTAGVGVLILILWRILWGFWGSETSRFSSFIVSPSTIITYVKTLPSRNSKAMAGHNPLGGVMVAVMIILLLLHPLLGLFATDGMFFSGPLRDMVDSSTAGQATAVHKILGIVLIVIACLHVSAILFYAIWKRIDLIRPMILGKASKKQADVMTHQPQMRSQIFAAILFLGVGGAVCLSLF